MKKDHKKQPPANTQEEINHLYFSEPRRQRGKAFDAELAASSAPQNSQPHESWRVGDKVFVFSIQRGIWVSGTIVKYRKPHARATTTTTTTTKTTVHNDRPLAIVNVQAADRSAAGCRAVPASTNTQLRVAAASIPESSAD
jgi:hypothetical protein